MKEKIFLPLLAFSLVITTSCGQNEDLSKEVENIAEENQNKESKQRGNHSFGGWYCPDNLGGFPPVDIQNLDAVPVVNGRLPTRVETQNGSSLIYIDPAEYPNAKPIDMVLPKLAWYYSHNTKQNELIIVIQAIEVDMDTVVGFRYINGGNGSAWFDEVDFLTEQETVDLGPTPFVFLDLQIKATKEEIWKTVIGTDYGQKISGMFEETSLVQSLWKPDAFVNFTYASDNMKASGMANSYWGTIYLQIDYDRKGNKSVEKVLILPNEDGNTAKVQVVSGPFGKDYEDQQMHWGKWLKELKEQSEVY